MSKRDFEGLLIIDHSESPGLTAEDTGGIGPVVGKGQVYKSPTITCVHCQVIVILNPLRTRPRNYCPKCDDYICDGCVVLPCRPFQKLVDETMEKVIKGLPVE